NRRNPCPDHTFRGREGGGLGGCGRPGRRGPHAGRAARPFGRDRPVAIEEIFRYDEGAKPLMAWLHRGNGEAEIQMGRIFEKRKESIFKTAAQKSKLYSKYGRQLYMAAKNGVPDPEANPTLRSVIERAKRDNVASHVIEKAIQKAAGTGGEDFQA